MKKIISILIAIALMLPCVTLASSTGIEVYLDGEKIDLDVQAQIIDGRTLIPVRGVFENAGGEVAYDEDTRYVTVSFGETEIMLAPYLKAAVVNGEARDVDVPPMIIDGRMMVPIRFISESAGFAVSYNEESKSVDVLTGKKKEPMIIPSLEIVNVTASEDDGNTPDRAADGDYNTRWSADDEVWIEFELAKVQPVGYVGVAWYCGNERQAIFEIHSSVDGKNYTEHFNGMQEDYTLDMTGYDLGGIEAKYIKIIGHANTQNEWNSITEFKAYPPREDGKIVVDNTGFGIEEGSIKVPEEIMEALRNFDNLLGKDVLEWCLSLYDPETGAFYYTKSGADNEGFSPLAEATEFVIEILRGGGLIEGAYLPDWWAEKLGPFIQQNQSEEDGYFYHECWGKTTGSRRDRDYNYSVILLRMCKTEPLYTLANDRIKATADDEKATEAVVATIPEYLQSEEAFIAWLDAKNWETDGIWSTGNSISSARSQIVAAGFGETLQQYLIEKQNPETGLWGTGNDREWMNLNGAMKLSGSFDSKCPYPNADKLLDSVLYVLENVELPKTAAPTYIWNPVEALKRAVATQSDADAAAIRAKLYEHGVELINFIYNRCLVYKAPDGGFSSNPGRATSIAQGGAVGLGGHEGDCDATVITSTRIRETLYSLFGLKAGKTHYVQYRDWFYEEMQNKEPIVKIKAQSVYDFEESEIGSLPDGWATSGECYVVEDPCNPLKNKCLKFTKSETGKSYNTSAKVSSSNNFKTAVFECDLMLENIGSADFFYNTVGGLASSAAGVQWVIRKGFSLGHRDSGNSQVQGMGTALNKNEWYKFRIEYTPKGLNDSVVKYFVDNEQVLETNVIYHGTNPGTLAEPKKKIDGIAFTSFLSGTGTFYLDNVSLTYIK